MNDAELVNLFVASFGRTDDMLTLDSLPTEIDAGSWGSSRFRRWQPVQVTTDPSALDEVYRTLPGRFPPLFERLVLSYRWLEVELGTVVLRANPLGPALEGLVECITRDPAWARVLFPLGLIPFAKGPGGCYDPVCFDTSHPDSAGDYPVIQVEHEAVLCDQRIGETWEIAGSSQALMEAVITNASLASRSPRPA